jgi:hypothetical protein
VRTDLQERHVASYNLPPLVAPAEAAHVGLGTTCACSSHPHASVCIGRWNEQSPSVASVRVRVFVGVTYGGGEAGGEVHFQVALEIEQDGHQHKQLGNVLKRRPALPARPPVPASVATWCSQAVPMRR